MLEDEAVGSLARTMASVVEVEGRDVGAREDCPVVLLCVPKARGLPNTAAHPDARPPVVHVPSHCPPLQGVSCSFTPTDIIISRPGMLSAAHPQPMPVSPNVAVGPGTATKYKPDYASYSEQWQAFAMRVNRQRMMGLPRGL